MTETIEGTVVGEEIEVREATPPATLFRTDEPKAIVERATEVADALAPIIRDKRLAVGISGREHVKVEGWTLLGTMLGVFPYCVWTRKLEDGWEARVEARTLAGALVGAAEAECVRSEKQWANRDDYALRSMAQTRATSKALRAPLGFVMQLAGYDPTPAEEMPRDEPKPKKKTKADYIGRIQELAAEGDALRTDGEPGLTYAEVEANCERSYQRPVQELTVDELTYVGKELAEWIKQSCPDKFTFVPF